MAIYPEQQYPGKITPSNSDYPFASAKNVSLPNSGDGFPLEKEWINDLLGWEQALLKKAGISPSGKADTARNSQYLAAMQALCGRIFKSVADLSRDQTMVGGDFALLTRYYSTEEDESTGVLIFEANMPKSAHDGVIFFSPTVPIGSGIDYRAGVGETEPTSKGVWRLVDGFISYNVSLNVPTQAPSINVALDLVRSIRTRKETQITILCDSGYELAEQITVVGNDFSNVIIKSNEAEVRLTDNFSGDYILYASRNATLPVIDILFNAQNRKIDGIRIDYASQGVVYQNKGVKNCAGYGLFVLNGSRFSGIGCAITNNKNNVYISTASNAALDFSDLSNASETALSIVDVSTVSCNQAKINNSKTGVNIASSIADFKATEIKNTSKNPLVAINSKLDGSNLIIQNAGDEVLVSDTSQATFASALFDTFPSSEALVIQSASQANASNATFLDIGSNGVRVAGGSSLNATGVTVKRVGSSGIFITLASNASLNQSSIEDCGNYGVYGQSSTIDLESATLKDTNGVALDRAASFNARSMQIEGYNSSGFRCYMGSRACLRDVKIRKSTTSGKLSTDILCREGSIVSSNGADAGFSGNLNELTNNGIIFG